MVSPGISIFSLFMFKYLVYLDLSSYVKHVLNFILFSIATSFPNFIPWIIHVLTTTLTYNLCHILNSHMHLCLLLRLLFHWLVSPHTVCQLQLLLQILNGWRPLQSSFLFSLHLLSEKARSDLWTLSFLAANMKTKSCQSHIQDI